MTFVLRLPFLQFGIGLFLFESEVEMCHMGSCESDKISEIEIGLSMGGGFTIGKEDAPRIEITPLYNIIYDDKVKYFTVNFGVFF